jgi:Fic family protein
MVATYPKNVSIKAQNSDISASTWDPRSPYNALPLLPPAVDLETKAVLKQCITARAALAGLKQAAELIPNQGTLINTLPVLEAQASSEIENIVTTVDKLFQVRETGANLDPMTKEALGYSDALLDGYNTLTDRPLSTSTAERVCSKIRGVEMRVRQIPGTALERQPSREVIYTPPVGEDLLRNLLANWERFLHEFKELDPLIRLAVAHYQFEAIHPFTDGNGRTGRILNNLFIVQEGLLTLPILYLSRYLIRNKSDYYQLLLDVTSKSAWEPWVLFVLKGVEETTIWTIEKIAAIQNLMSHTASFVHKMLTKIYTSDLIWLIFENPICRIAHVVEAGLAERQTASRYLKELARIGILWEQGVGREKFFVHTKLMELLTHDKNTFDDYSPNSVRPQK